jgi:UbiD family decarboxylase
VAVLAVTLSGRRDSGPRTRHGIGAPRRIGAMDRQSLRHFVAAYGAAHPQEVVRVSDTVSLEHDVMALVLEYERRRRYPVLLFEQVAGSDIPIIANAVASRRALAFALDTTERGLAAEYARRIKDHIKPVIAADPPFRARVLRGADVDLGVLPIPEYFPGDAGRYLTAGMLVARDPETGVETEGYHRFQVKGRTKMGVSLHSRRRMFEYQRRAEAKGQPLPCAVVLGLHPLVSMGSLAYPPPDVGKFEVVGGLFGEPFQVAPCLTADLHVPAAAEIVIEGEILPGVREPEGPFGEFTGYFSRRSTQHVFEARAIAMRERPWFQSIGSGRAGDHITTLGLIREAEITNAVSRVIPNVTGVHVPLSGTSSFTAYVAIKQSRPGEAKHVIPIVLGVDHYLKLVIVVDDDIDVFDESDVMWAVATRMQADRDLVVISGSLGAMLDPSADERGVTAKLGIDATRPFGEPFAEKLVMSPDRMAWARALVDRLGG